MVAMSPAPRWPIILRAIFRLIAGSSLVPAFLVAGVLSFPASCQCGSALPHDHSLFALASHSHVGGSASAHHHGVAKAEDTPARRNATELRINGPAFQMATDVASGQARSVCLLSADAPLDCGGNHTPFDEALHSSGMLLVPESPPPQA
jgi:hypothetical protein